MNQGVKISILDEINEALAANETLIGALNAGELPFNLLSQPDLNDMSIGQLKAILLSVSVSDVVRRKATDLINAYEDKTKQLEAEGKCSPKEIEDQAIKAMDTEKTLWKLREELCET